MSPLMAVLSWEGQPHMEGGREHLCVLAPHLAQMIVVGVGEVSVGRS